MRIISGEFRGRVLKTPEGLDTRPTPSRLREALFNILQQEIAGTVFLDAYAGTGSVGIEALSRGARRAIFVERSRLPVNLLKENLSMLKAYSRADVVHGRTLQQLPKLKADIAFIDPPYDLAGEYRESLTILGQADVQLVIAQHSSRTELADEYGGLRKNRVVKQGENSLSFYRRESTSS